MRSLECVSPLALGLALGACRDLDLEPDVTADDSGTGNEEVGHTDAYDGSSTGGDGDGDELACAEACSDTSTDRGRKLCYACRCKVAFDGWLPGVEALQCSNAEPIVTYRADVSTSEVVLEPIPIYAAECSNPSFLTGSCLPGSRLGQLAHGDVVFEWICREPYLGAAGEILYHDVAIIGHNTRTGATCFWDDVDDVTHADGLPPLDLLEATEEERARFDEMFSFTDGEVCVKCHDHDPFLYTPYLQSTRWTSFAARKGPYARVDLDGRLRPTGNWHLVSPQAAACTSCHRIGSAGMCARFVRDSFGEATSPSHEQAVRDAGQPGSPHWRLAYWMPTEDVALTDFAQWLAQFGDARDHILECCAAPGEDVGDCRWEPVPGGA